MFKLYNTNISFIVFVDHFLTLSESQSGTISASVE